MAYIDVPHDFYLTAPRWALGGRAQEYLRSLANQPEQFPWTQVHCVDGKWEPADQLHPMIQARLMARLEARRAMLKETA